MATWAQMQADLPLLLAELLGIPCDWRTQSRGMHTSARAQLDVITAVGIGVDEPVWADVRHESDEQPVAVRATVHGIREMTLQVSVWTQQQALSQSARAYLEALRLRLAWPSVVARLSAMGLALVRVERVVQLDPDSDGRIHSEASIDVRFGYGMSEADVSVPYIETARITSASLGVDITVPEP